MEEGLDPVAPLQGQKGGCVRCSTWAKHHSIELIYSFNKNFIMRIFSAKQGSLPTRSFRVSVGRGVQSRELQIPRPRSSILPSRRARRQRDEPPQLPGLRVPPTARGAPAGLLLHSPARGGAAAPGARPAPASRSALIRAAGGTAVVRSSFAALPLLLGPPRRW